MQLWRRQGPNYALAKRLQSWRAMVARADGQPVSINVAPATATASVVSNPQFAAAYEVSSADARVLACHRFGTEKLPCPQRHEAR